MALAIELLTRSVNLNAGNALAIILGGALGLMFGQALEEKIKVTLIQGLGLAVLLIHGHHHRPIEKAINEKGGPMIITFSAMTLKIW